MINVSYPGSGIINLSLPRLTVGATEVACFPLTGVGSVEPYTAALGVFFKAAAENTGNVCIIATGGSTSSGIQLAPGEGVFLPVCAKLEDLYAIATAADQYLYRAFV